MHGERLHRGPDKDLVLAVRTSMAPFENGLLAPKSKSTPKKTNTESMGSSLSPHHPFRWLQAVGAMPFSIAPAFAGGGLFRGEAIGERTRDGHLENASLA